MYDEEMCACGEMGLDIVQCGFLAEVPSGSPWRARMLLRI